MDSCPEHNKRQNENAQDHWCHTAHKLRNINSIATNTETFKLFPENTKNIQQIMKEALPNIISSHIAIYQHSPNHFNPNRSLGFLSVIWQWKILYFPNDVLNSCVNPTQSWIKSWDLAYFVPMQNNTYFLMLPIRIQVMVNRRLIANILPARHHEIILQKLHPRDTS